MTKLIANPKTFAATGILFVLATVFNAGFAANAGNFPTPTTHISPAPAPLPPDDPKPTMNAHISPAPAPLPPDDPKPTFGKN